MCIRDRFNSNQGTESGGGIYFDSGKLSGSSIDFGLDDKANDPDDIGLSGGIFGLDSYSELGADSDFVCEAFSQSGYCQF